MAEVEELAAMVRDNLNTKHLVLSVEEILVEFLQAPFSGKVMLLELEPMGSYQRMLLHRLADIFGLAHESIGEGDERHLVIQRAPDSTIPSVMVSHVLQTIYGESSQPPSTRQLLRRDSPDAGTSTKEETQDEPVVRFSAQELTNGRNDNASTPRPANRSISMAAKRMISRALG